MKNKKCFLLIISILFCILATAKNNYTELCNSNYTYLLRHNIGVANSETSKSHDSDSCFSRNRKGYASFCFNSKTISMSKYKEDYRYDTNIGQYHTTKYLLLKKTNFKCFYCGVNLTVSKTQKEHFIPRSKGGENKVNSGNIVPSCYSCNMKKGTKTLEKFRIKLFGKRYKLFYFEIHNIKINENFNYE
ncbi:HNH endonuclease [Winogradskyella sp.]